MTAISYLPKLAYACSVCFGDPKSLFSKGAIAGVLFLLSVVLLVLGGIAATILVWSRRARSGSS